MMYALNNIIISIFTLTLFHLFLLLYSLRLLFDIDWRLAVQSFPNLVEEDLSPTRLQSGRTRFFNLELHQTILDGLWALAAFQHVSVNVLTRRVGAQ